MHHPIFLYVGSTVLKQVAFSGSTLFWSRRLSGSEWRNPWLKGNSMEATTAAWALRGMLSARLLDESVPVVRYLLQAYSPVDPDPDVVCWCHKQHEIIFLVKILENAWLVCYLINLVTAKPNDDNKRY